MNSLAHDELRDVDAIPVSQEALENLESAEKAYDAACKAIQVELLAYLEEHPETKVHWSLPRFWGMPGVPAK